MDLWWKLQDFLSIGWAKTPIGTKHLTEYVINCEDKTELTERDILHSHTWAPPYLYWMPEEQTIKL